MMIYEYMKVVSHESNKTVVGNFTFHMLFFPYVYLEVA